MPFLDSDGLKAYTSKIKSLINTIMIECGVATFNGRAGVVTPQADDYSVDMVTGAAPTNAPVFTGSISMNRKSGTAVGANSVTTGYNCAATNAQTYAVGYNALASGTCSHAEGWETSATGNSSHTEGFCTKASNIGAHVSGKFNKEMTSGANQTNLIGDVFVVGNGTGVNASTASNVYSNALRLDYSGQLYLTKAYKSTGADYAEYFEWLDGNPDAEDRVGHFVTLKGTKIVYAEPGDYVLGVVSGQPCIIGNADEDWLGRWVHDDFNRFVKEYLLMHEVEVAPPESLTEDELHMWLLENQIEERDGHYFKMEEEIVDYPTPYWRHKANPSYDATQAYIERQDRKEWDAVGMVGVLSVIDDGSCIVNGYAKVASNGIAAKAESYVSRETFRVISRVTENIIKILLL